MLSLSFVHTLHTFTHIVRAVKNLSNFLCMWQTEERKKQQPATTPLSLSCRSHIFWQAMSCIRAHVDGSKFWHSAQARNTKRLHTSSRHLSPLSAADKSGVDLRPVSWLRGKAGLERKFLLSQGGRMSCQMSRGCFPYPRRASRHVPHLWCAALESGVTQSLWHLQPSVAKTQEAPKFRSGFGEFNIRSYVSFNLRTPCKRHQEQAHRWSCCCCPRSGILPLVTSLRADSQNWARKRSSGWTVPISWKGVHTLFPNWSQSEQWRSDCFF